MDQHNPTTLNRLTRVKSATRPKGLEAHPDLNTIFLNHLYNSSMENADQNLQAAFDKVSQTYLLHTADFKSIDDFIDFYYTKTKRGYEPNKNYNNILAFWDANKSIFTKKYILNSNLARDIMLLAHMRDVENLYQKLSHSRSSDPNNHLAIDFEEVCNGFGIKF